MVITERGDPSTVRDPRSSVGVSELIFPCSVSPSLCTYPSPVISLGVSCRHPFRGGNRKKTSHPRTRPRCHRDESPMQGDDGGALRRFSLAPREQNSPFVRREDFFFFVSRNCQGLGFRNIYVSYIHISLELVHLVGFIVEGGRLTFHPQLKVKRQAATKIEAQLSTTHTL